MRALASQSGRAPGVYPGHRLYLLTGLLTRLIGTEKTERDAEDGHRAIPQVSETSETPKTHVVWLVTQRRQITRAKAADPGCDCATACGVDAQHARYGNMPFGFVGVWLG